MEIIRKYSGYWNIRHSETPDKQSFSRVAKLLITKSTARFSKPSRNCVRKFSSCARIRLHVCSRIEMLETVYENDLFDMFLLFSSVVHILD